MAQLKQCPQCGATEFKPDGKGDVHCVRCGADLVYRTPWQAVVVAWAVVGALLGGGSNLLFRALGWHVAGAARWVPVFLLVAFISHAIARRFRRLSRV
jgi:hypothetical protein